jgi:hypothetical protein
MNGRRFDPAVANNLDLVRFIAATMVLATTATRSPAGRRSRHRSATKRSAGSPSRSSSRLHRCDLRGDARLRVRVVASRRASGAARRKRAALRIEHGPAAVTTAL